MKFFRLAFTLSFLIIGIAFAGARELPYTGQLYNGATPVGGTSGQNQQFYFRIYSAQTGGSLLWQSGATVTQFIKNGLLSVNLGDTSVMNPLTESIFNESNSLWLEVQTAPLGNALVTLSPRRKITTSAYSYDANRLGGIDASQYMRKWTNVITVGFTGPAGGADFASINAALIDAGGRATPANRYTVLVLPGTYMDPVINDMANVDLIGLDRDNCIIMGTLTINFNTLVENLTFDNTTTGGNGIDIAGGNPTINNVKTIGGQYGINVLPIALGATVHNLNVVQAALSAVMDQSGITIDGLRADCRCFDVNLMAPDAIFNYKNILQTKSAGLLGNIQSGSGSIRSIKGKNSINILKCLKIKIRDAHIKTQGGTALFIQGIDPFGYVEIYDSTLESSFSHAAQIGTFDDPIPIESPVLFNDVKFISKLSNGILGFNITNITVEDCEIDAGNNGIECPQNAGGFATAQLYVQTTKIVAATYGINLGGATELWIYDSAIKSLNNSVLGNTVAPGTTPAPRIADCKFDTDTNPTQGAGIPGWNAFMAFGGFGNVGGLGEDTAGNIVQPGAGSPVIP